MSSVSASKDTATEPPLNSAPSPVEERDTTDPGDEVQRKFRYQHAYGVVLSIGMTSGRLDYKAIWCEQHEDFIAEYESGIFDAYQIKTKKSELGEWEINEEAFYKSIKRFLKLDKKYPNQFASFRFVSNTQYSNSADKKREYLSPVRLIDAVKKATSWQELPKAAMEGMIWLKDKLEVDEDSLFAVLRRVHLVLGPTERAFEDELCSSHIPTLKKCASMTTTTLRKAMEALIGTFAQAASVVSSDPSKHWQDQITKGSSDPLLIAKRITKNHVELAIREFQDPSFRYLSTLGSLNLGSASTKMDTLQQKLIRGDLASRYEVLRRQSLSAEQKLLDLATRPDDGEATCSQIENVVLTECDEANLRASQGSHPFGPAMLIDVQDRLKSIANSTPSKVDHQPYEVLVGVSGLLTSECKVWWSNQFPIDNAL